jgi:asparagine synthase (glutamine-hydrolysing)
MAETVTSVFGGHKPARRVLGGRIAIHLPDRQYTINELLWSFYSQFDPATYTAMFDSRSYYAELETKVMGVLGSNERTLPRPAIKWLYHSFRCRAWNGKFDSIASRYRFTAMPYLERSITKHASTLPLRWKNHGAYESRSDPARRQPARRISLKLRSQFQRTSAAFTPAVRLLTHLRPPSLRRYTYRVPKYVAVRMIGPSISRRRTTTQWSGIAILRRLFRLNRVADQAQYERILSLEFALRQFGYRVKVDF